MTNTPIIPFQQSFYKKDSMELCQWPKGREQLDYKAICEFTAIGFFLDDSTFYQNIKALPPASSYTLENGKISNLKSRWEWKYEPRDISLKQATEEFAQTFEEVSNRGLSGKRVILPISGGLDSRSQAVALRNHGNVNAYSYQFDNGFEETGIAREIADKLKYPFKPFYIKPGYLWNRIEELADINQCFSDFTHPRQMAVKEEIGSMGDVFHLGHWGDVLFDDMGIDENAPKEERSQLILKKIIKKGGLELANALWEAFGLEGSFESYLKQKVFSLMDDIKIESANAHVRAFKSMYWAPRWTSINMAVFSDEKPIVLPFYSDEICEFITTIPEKHLAKRQIQIEYMKAAAPEIAGVTWQDYKPFNLYNFQKRDSASYIPVRAVKKAKRLFKENVLGKKPATQRNWELQFLGDDNRKHLESYLFKNDSFKDLLPEAVVKDFYQKFNEGDQVWYSHPLSMLLTLSLFSNRHFKK